MKLTRQNLRHMIWEHLRSESLFEDAGDVSEVLDEEVMQMPSESLEGVFELVDGHNLLTETQEKLEELKSISEEIRRMKQLVDFRSPLLSDKKD